MRLQLAFLVFFGLGGCRLTGSGGGGGDGDAGQVCGINAAACPVAVDLSAGAGGTDGGADLGAVAARDLAMPIYRLVSGTYTVNNIVKTTDGCNLSLETSFTMLQVTNNGMGHLALGNMCPSTGNPPTCNPAVYEVGEGDFTSSYNATTTATTMVTADSAAPPCTYTRTRTAVVTLTATNTLHIDFTEDESNIAMAACGLNLSTCESKYAFDASM